MPAKRFECIAKAGNADRERSYLLKVELRDLHPGLPEAGRECTRRSHGAPLIQSMRRARTGSMDAAR
jgi:hypothetical protein